MKLRKFKNIPTVVDGIKFDSKREAKRWYELKILERTGYISDLERQVAFELVEAVKLNGKKKRAIVYIADYVYWRGFELVVEDVKSEVTKKLPKFRLKKHMMKAFYNIEIKEV